MTFHFHQSLSSSPNQRPMKSLHSPHLTKLFLSCMSQPHYEYPSRSTWLGYQATKQEHVLATTPNKMQDSNHVTSYPDWRQNSGDSYFPQVGAVPLDTPVFYFLLLVSSKSEKMSSRTLLPYFLTAFRS